MIKHNFLSFIPSSKVNFLRLKYFLWNCSIPLSLGLIFTYPSNAQQAINFGRSPSINVLTNPSITDSIYKTSPNAGFDCPTPSLSLGLFGAGADDSSNDFTNNGRADNDIINYGIAAGIRVPLGGKSSKYCKDYSKAISEKAQLETEGIRRDNQITLLRQCYWLFSNRINIDQEIFKSGEFSSLKSCNKLDIRPLQGGSNPPPKTPPKAPRTEIKNPSIIIQQQD